MRARRWTNLIRLCHCISVYIPGFHLRSINLGHRKTRNESMISSRDCKRNFNDCFQLWTLSKWDLRISTVRKLDSEFNTFKPRKMPISSTSLIRLRFQEYYCESGIDIFAWKITWNYAAVPLKYKWVKTQISKLEPTVMEKLFTWITNYVQSYSGTPLTNLLEICYVLSLI